MRVKASWLPLIEVTMTMLISELGLLFSCCSKATGRMTVAQT